MPSESSGSVRIFYPRLDRDALIAELRGRIGALSDALPITRVVLFGSWANGRATAFSDIDLLVVYAGPVREDAYKVVWRTMNTRGLEPHVYSEDEAEAVAPTLALMTEKGINLL